PAVAGGLPSVPTPRSSDLVLLLPAASRATAVRVCEPLSDVLVPTETEYGALVSSAPSGAPSTKNCTPTTPTLSEALADTVSVPCARKRTPLDSSHTLRAAA